MSTVSEAKEIAEKVPDALKWAKQSDDADTAEIVEKFTQRITDRSRTRTARIEGMAARRLCEGFNHYDGARRMRACNLCVGAIRIAMVFEPSGAAVTEETPHD